MLGSLQGAYAQNVRWETGRLELAESYVPRLLRAAIERRSVVMFDAALESIVPPFSVTFAAGVAALLAAAPLGQSRGDRSGGLLAVLGQVLYTLVGLWLVAAPRPRSSSRCSTPRSTSSGSSSCGRPWSSASAIARASGCARRAPSSGPPQGRRVSRRSSASAPAPTRPTATPCAARGSRRPPERGAAGAAGARRAPMIRPNSPPS